MLSGQDSPYEGIILRTYPYGESDLILRVLSPTHGKVSVIAKGARREKSKFQTNFDVFDAGSFETRRGRGNLENLLFFKPHRSLKRVRDNIDTFIISSTVVEAYDHLIHEHTSDGHEYYESLALGLRALDEAATLKEGLRACYLSLHMLLRTAGFGTLEVDVGPSRKNLLLLLDSIENASERQLLTKSGLIGLLVGLTSNQ